MEHYTGRCPVLWQRYELGNISAAAPDKAGSTVEQIEGYQQHMERKFWEQVFIACIASPFDAIGSASGRNLDPHEAADIALKDWRYRWGKK